MERIMMRMLCLGLCFSLGISLAQAEDHDELAREIALKAKVRELTQEFKTTYQTEIETGKEMDAIEVLIIRMSIAKYSSEKITLVKKALEQITQEQEKNIESLRDISRQLEILAPDTFDDILRLNDIDLSDLETFHLKALRHRDLIARPNDQIPYYPHNDWNSSATTEMNIAKLLQKFEIPPEINKIGHVEQASWELKLLQNDLNLYFIKLKIFEELIKLVQATDGSRSLIESLKLDLQGRQKDFEFQASLYHRVATVLQKLDRDAYEKVNAKNIADLIAHNPQIWDDEIKAIYSAIDKKKRFRAPKMEIMLNIGKELHRTSARRWHIVRLFRTFASEHQINWYKTVDRFLQINRMIDCVANFAPPSEK